MGIDGLYMRHGAPRPRPKSRQGKDLCLVMSYIVTSHTPCGRLGTPWNSCKAFPIVFALFNLSKFEFLLVCFQNQAKLCLPRFAISLKHFVCFSVLLKCFHWRKTRSNHQYILHSFHCNMARVVFGFLTSHDTFCGWKTSIHNFGSLFVVTRRGNAPLSFGWKPNHFTWNVTGYSGPCGLCSHLSRLTTGPIH